MGGVKAIGQFTDFPLDGNTLLVSKFGNLRGSSDVVLVIIITVDGHDQTEPLVNRPNGPVVTRAFIENESAGHRSVWLACLKSAVGLADLFVLGIFRNVQKPSTPND